MSKWRNIKSVPKDGTKVLVICMKAFPGFEDRVGDMEVDFWRADFKGFGKFNNSFWPATHWMPLPSPPVLDAKEAGE